MMVRLIASSLRIIVELSVLGLYLAVRRRRIAEAPIGYGRARVIIQRG